MRVSEKFTKDNRLVSNYLIIHLATIHSSWDKLISLFCKFVLQPHFSCETCN